ncbi:hypothetical protein CONLIGDRAFT_706238, partial [Coniochaeta ligniaria NRRL 30616]
NSSNFADVGKRPGIVTYIERPVFHVGDKVYLLTSSGSREGPYVVASLPSAGACTLSHEDGKAVEGGKEIGIDCVERAV